MPGFLLSVHAYVSSFLWGFQCTQCALHSQDELCTFTAVLCVVHKGEALTLLPGATRLSGTVPVLLVVALMDSMDTDFP